MNDPDVQRIRPVVVEEHNPAVEPSDPGGGGVPVILVLGGADAAPTARAIARSIATAACSARATIVDASGGALGGELVRAAERAGVTHLAVDAPGSAPERGGTAVPTTGADEPDVAAQAEDEAGDEPVVVVVVGGDAVTAQRAIAAAARGWSVVPVAGTGGLASQLVAERAGRRPGRRARAVPEHVAELLEHRVLAPAESGADLTNRVVWELHDVPTLKLMWNRLAVYDETASRLRRSAGRLEESILALGVVVTFLALFDNALTQSGIEGWWDDVIHWSLVLLPATVSLSIALSATLASGKRWVMLRSATEQMRREIFGWRTRTGVYEDQDGDPAARHRATVRLADRVAAIEAHLMRSEVGTSTLRTVSEPHAVALAGGHADDDGISVIGPDDYLKLRLEHQLDYYRSRVGRLSRRLRGLQIVSIVAGAAGSVLALTGNEIWIGLTTAIAAAVVAHIGKAQIDTTLAGYNQAIADLEAIRSRWHAVPPSARERAQFAELVARVEHALQAEQSSWQKQMSLALDTPFAGGA